MGMVKADKVAAKTNLSSNFEIRLPSYRHQKPQSQTYFSSLACTVYQIGFRSVQT